MDLNFLSLLLRQLYNAVILPKLREKFGKDIPGDVLGDVSAGLFEILSGTPVTQIGKGVVLAMVDNVVRDYETSVKLGIDK